MNLQKNIPFPQERPSHTPQVSTPQTYHQVKISSFRILLSLKKEFNLDTDYNTNEPWRHCGCVLSCFQLYLTLCDPIDHSLLGSSVHGILQTRILEWVALPSSRGSSQPRDWTLISCVFYIAGGFFTTSTTWEDIILSEINQSQKDKCCRIPLIGGP